MHSFSIVIQNNNGPLGLAGIIDFGTFSISTNDSNLWTVEDDLCNSRGIERTSTADVDIQNIRYTYTMLKIDDKKTGQLNGKFCKFKLNLCQENKFDIKNEMTFQVKDLISIDASKVASLSVFIQPDNNFKGTFSTNSKEITQSTQLAITDTFTYSADPTSIYSEQANINLYDTASSTIVMSCGISFHIAFISCETFDYKKNLY